MRNLTTVLGLAVMSTGIISATLVSVASADSFGTGANQFEIDFVTIPGDAGDLGSWPAGSLLTFTGVNRDDYRIGVYEITNDQWNKFKAELGVPVTGDPSYAYDQDPYWTGSNVPTNNVTWLEAAQFVNWLNTSNGYQAAYRFVNTQGTSSYSIAPWDPEDAEGMDQLRHKDAFYYLPTQPEWVKAGYWNGSELQMWATPDGTEPVEDIEANYGRESGASPWNVGTGSEELNGTFDIMANVWEWMEGPWDGNYGSAHLNRGGSYWSSISDNGHGTDILSSTQATGWDIAYVDVGFRVAADVPEPSSFGLLLSAVIATVAPRRHTLPPQDPDTSPP